MSSELSRITDMDHYMREFGQCLGRKAVANLNPLHIPGRDPLPDFSYAPDDRQPFPAQADCVAAITKMFDEQGSGFLVGQMGTGKTIMGILAIHTHAKGAKGQPYRVLLMVPDVILNKWQDEILETIPTAVVRQFQKWSEILELMQHRHLRRKTIPGDQPTATGKTCWVATEDGGAVEVEMKRSANSGKVIQERATWGKPLGPEWFLVGRDQVKHNPGWIGVGEPFWGFGNHQDTLQSSSLLEIDKVPVMDDRGFPVIDRKTGFQKYKAVYQRVITCPSCGQVVRDKRDQIIKIESAGKKQHTCTGVYLREVPVATKKTSGLDRRLVPHRMQDKSVGKIVELTADATYGKVKYRIAACKEPLWNWVGDERGKGHRWPMAKIVHKKLTGLFPYLVLDEVHQLKSDESAQSMAGGKLMAQAKHILALTGTLIGGYSHHLYPLLMRICPQGLKDEGFAWGHDFPFASRYGVVARIVTTSQGGDEGGHVPTYGKRAKSMRKARSGAKVSERHVIKPGIMPTLFGRHLIGHAIFISLMEMADQLPSLFEYIGGDCPPMEKGEDPDDYRRMADWWIETAITMDQEQEDAYRVVETTLVEACRELLKGGNMKLLGTMLHTTLDYPDRPFGWHPQFPDTLAVGYWATPKVYTEENWVGVVTPDELDSVVVRPKEQALIDICKKCVQAGEQAWVYCQMTRTRDIQPRLRSLLEQNGIAAGILPTGSKVKPREREQWIIDNGKHYDVMISHPQPVGVGLDFFEKKRGDHNFNNIVFYQTGYNTFTVKQAAARAWRIGQTRDCRVYYLYYRNTMQHRAMKVIADKLGAMDQIAGDFTADGIVALSSDNGAMAMARAMSQQISDMDVQRNWAKVVSDPAKRHKAKKPKEYTPPPKATPDDAALPLDFTDWTMPEEEDTEIDWSTLDLEGLEAPEDYGLDLPVLEDLPAMEAHHGAPASLQGMPIDEPTGDISRQLVKDTLAEHTPDLSPEDLSDFLDQFPSLDQIPSEDFFEEDPEEDDEGDFTVIEEIMDEPDEELDWEGLDLDPDL